MAEKQKKHSFQQKAEGKIRQVLLDSEKLIATIAGYPFHGQTDTKAISIDPIITTIFSTLSVLYIGLTNQSLIVIKESSFGQRLSIDRISIKQLKWAEYTSDKPSDKFSIYWDSQRIDLLVLPKYPGREAQIILEVVQKNGDSAKVTKSSFHSSPDHPFSSRIVFKTKEGKLSTKALIVLFILAGFVVGLIGTPFVGDPSSRFFKPVAGLLTATLFTLWGFSGLVVVIRKELPYSFLNFRGKYTVIPGIGCATLCWGVALWALISIFR